MKKQLLLILLLITTAFTGNAVFAQGVTTASINGVVTDGKAPIPGATVILTHIPSGTVYSVITRGNGRYNLINVKVGGPYTLKITYIGFTAYVQENLNLSIGQDQAINVKLSDGATDLNEVKIAGNGGKVMNSSRTGARETITRAQIDALPTVNRSLADFTKLTPSASSTSALSFGGRSSAFNNITVDGALFNNSFGLSGTLGGQTNSQPISLDAIDQIQVDLAPYDVRQGFFTGAGVNTVIKSGTNDIKATVYYYGRGTGLTGYDAGTTQITKTPFDYNSRGFSLGGPIIKNKLFFFVSGEQERITTPATSYTATGSGSASATTSQVTSATLDAIAAKLKTLGYDPGPYENYSYKTSSDKVTVKLDWNIDKNNTLSAKYFYLKSFKDQPASNSGITNNKVGYGTTRAPSTTTLPFYGSGYEINNNFNIGMLELNSKISNTISNKLTVGYSALRDYRTSLSSSTTPMVDIGNGTSAADGTIITGATNVATSFGYELYTAGNLLSSNIGQLSDDLTIFAGKHEITFGTSNQSQSFVNGFAPDYNGLYTYNSASDFLNGLPAQAYTYRNATSGSTAVPSVKIKAYNFSLYGQDKFRAADNFVLTYGIRLDYNTYPTTLPTNANAAALTFQQGIQVDESKLPKSKVQMSPRVGFNWDVNGDHTTQIRGGSGLFAGLTPFVWISNQASNGGTLFSSGTITKTATPNSPALIYNPNVNANRPTGAVAANTTYELDATNPNLKLPKIFRSNLAIDQQLPGGIIGTIEGSFTKDINAIYTENLVLSNTTTTFPGIEGQTRYTSANTTINGSPVSAANPTVSGLYYMTNTNKGYSYFGTVQLQKSFLSGFYANIAYTHTASKDVNDGGSTASSIWSGRQVAGNPNADNLSNSSYVMPNRFIASFAYRKEYAKNYATSVGIFFERANAGAVSYITSGDPNGDGATNDLMYIPKNKGDIILVPDGTKDTRTPDQIWTQLNNFINQDKYLSSHRGEFAQRNGVILPYFQRADLNITQDFYVKSGRENKTKNTIRVEFNIINVGNLLNRNWGLYQNSFNGFNSGSTTVLKYIGVDPVTKRATYAFPYLDATSLTPITTSYKTNTDQISRWQAQIGVRYIFN